MSLVGVVIGAVIMQALLFGGQILADRKRGNYLLWAFGVPAVAFALFVVAFAGVSQATPGWGLRMVSQQEAPNDQQVVTLWAVQTPSGTHACVTANYGSGGSSNRPIWLTCDWSR